MKAWSNLAKVVYKRTYSRNDEGSSPENWKATVDRVLGGNIRGFDVSAEEKNKLFELMINRKAMPARKRIVVFWN